MNSSLDPTIFAAAIVTVLSSLGGLLVLVINARSQAAGRREEAEMRKALFNQGQQTLKYSDESNKKADEIKIGTAEIHALANSTNSNLQKTVELMEEKNRGLELLMQQMVEEKQTLAAKQAQTEIQNLIVSQQPTKVEVVNPTTAPVPTTTTTT